MSESIGSIYSTKIPLLSENADIQEALRLYHYGAGAGTYSPTNTNIENLLPQSIAYYLNSLQTQITSVSGTLGVQASTWTGKGTLVTSTAAGVIYSLSIGATNGMVLTVKSSASNGTGMEWVVPSVLADNIVTLSYKTLDNPKFLSGGYIADNSGQPLISFPTTVTSAVNAVTISNAATGNKPSISATGSDTNITLNLISKGTGTVQINGSDVPTLAGVQTFTNKTLSNPTIINDLYLGTVLSNPSKIVFEGSTDDAFETTLTVVDPTADRTVTIPNVDGTLITTGNLTSITSTGTITSGAWNGTSITTQYGGTGLSGTTPFTLNGAVYASSTSALTTGTLPTASGGTNLTSFTSGGAMYATSTSALTTGTLPAISGGTGQALYTVGDILYANTTTTLNKLSATTNGYLLTLVAGVPAWAAAPVSLPTQTGNGGKYLTTDGTTASWATIAAGYTAPTIGSTLIASGTTYTTLPGVTSVNGLTLPATGGTALVTTATSQTVSGNLISHIATNAQTASYSIVAADDGKIVEINNATANTITVPLNTAQAIPVGSQINIIQTGVGQTTVVPTTVTTATYASGGAAAATTVVIAATNAAILAGQKITGIGFADNTYVVSVSTTTITFFPAATSQISGTLTFSIPVFATPGLKLRSQWSSATLIKRVADSRTSTNYSNDTWVLLGDLTA